MADVEEPRFNSLAERIAALNAQKNFQAPPSTAGKRPPPPPPPVRAATITTTTTTTPSPSPQQPQNETAPVMPPRPVRASTEKLPPLPRRTTTDIEKGDRPAPGPGLGRVLPPPLPSRDSSSAKGTPPALPSRRPSSNLTLPTPGGRRNSNSSDISYISTMSSLSLNQDGPTPRRGLPPPLEQAKLPPLPPTRRELEAKAKEEAANTPPLPRRVTEPPPQTMPELPSGRPSLPPRLPSRPAKSPLMNATEAPSPSLPARRLPPPPSSYKNPKSALELGFNNKPRPADDVPPPIPLASRPSISQIEAVRSASTPSPAAAAAAAAASSSSSSSSSPPSCLVCRDFSGPDTVAAQYPYTSLPRQDPISYLAHHLCSPFPSPTDKARAIFTWCHHNIAYDVHGFFNNCIPRGLTPAETIFSGKAVCEGYAKVYEAIARAAGLHCIVVGGHGKGYGFSALKKGERCPPKDPTGHAWNAVMIDNDEWKLIDPCWGAGHLDGGTNGYKKQFSPGQFARSNEFFGRSHYPSDERHFHRRDGKVPSWEEYILGETGGEEPAGWMGDAEREGGLDQSNFEPKQKEICVSGAGEGTVTRFQFGKVCPHWVSEKHGRGRQMLICLVFGEDEKRAGGKERFVPLETDGFWWWLDVRTRDLGGVGKRVRLVGITTVDGRDARGLTGEEFKGVVGRKAFAMCGMVDWVLV